MSSKEQVHSDDKATAKLRSSQREVQNFETLTQQTHPATIIRGARIAPSSLTSRDVLQLQRAIGNQAVRRLLAGEGTGRPTVQRASGDGQLPERTVQKQVSETMGHDFSGVRVHSDSEPDTLSTQLTAKAFTAGPDIFFKRGAHYPASTGGLSRGGGARASARGEPRRVAVSKLQSPITASLTVQRDWKVEELVNALRGIDLESFGVRPKTYKFYKVDTLPWNEEKYESKKHWALGHKPVEVISHQAKGYHDRKNMEIGVSRDFDAKEAAATIVHEATHAGQYEEAEEKKEAMADLVEREVEAHMTEERFRIQKGIPPKVPKIKRMMVEGKEGVDEKSVRQFVQEKYGHAEEKYYIIRVPKPIAKNFENKVRQKFKG